MTRSPLAERMFELTAGGVPFVRALVVRAQSPTSARAGDAAIVLADGTLDGFVGGQCAEGSVRAAALGVLHHNEPLLLRVLPEGEPEPPDDEGSFTVVNPCLSGGALEIFLEPRLPDPVLGVVGITPTADAVVALAEPLGFDVRRRPDGTTDPAGAIGLVVAGHGRHEEESISAALDAGVGFIGLVASEARGAAVLDPMGLTGPQRARIHTPVGLDIGARTPEEIALSIVARLVRAIRLEGLEAPARPDAPTGPREAVDPVCHMTVVIGPDTPHRRVDGQDLWFCGTGCRDRSAAES